MCNRGCKASTLEAMKSWPPNWDKQGAEAPNHVSIANATRSLVAFHNLAEKHNLAWCDPYISASQEGEVVFEWWKGVRKLTFYFQESEVVYLRVWGPNMHSEMVDGVLDKDDTFDSLLTWLVT